MSGGGKLTIGGSISVCGLIVASIFASCSGEIQTTPAAARMGWHPEIVKTPEHAKIVAAMPPFELRDDEGNRIVQDNAGANVRLWKWAKMVSGGEHLPNIAQEVGDCVSHGGANAINYTAATQIGEKGTPEEFRRAYPPYLYGISRIQIGNGQLRGDGSVGAWLAKGVQEYGVLPIDGQNVPPYSGSVARQWGNKPGPPKSFIDAARPFTVQTVAKMRSADDVRDAVCNGYGVSIASDAGFLMTPPLVNGRRINRRSGTWNHQMSIVGYDGATHTEPLWYILNSWGPNAHGAPGGDEPPGGFWATRKDVEYIVKQGDSFAFSGFKGFPAQQLDFRIFGTKAPREPVKLQLFPEKKSGAAVGRSRFLNAV